MLNLEKCMDAHLNRNFFVFVLSCLAVKSNNMLTLVLNELFWQLHSLLPKGHDYLEEYKSSSRENTNAYKAWYIKSFLLYVYYPEIELQCRLQVKHYERTSSRQIYQYLDLRVYWNVEHFLSQLKFVESPRLWNYKVVKAMNSSSFLKCKNSVKWIFTSFLFKTFYHSDDIFLFQFFFSW